MKMQHTLAGALRANIGVALAWAVVGTVCPDPIVNILFLRHAVGAFSSQRFPLFILLCFELIVGLCFVMRLEESFVMR